MVRCAPRCMLKSCVRGRQVASPRQLSTLKAVDQTRFSYFSLPEDKPSDLLAKLRDNAVLENSNRHNAAVVLATPDLARELDDHHFTSSLVELLSASASIDSFQLVCAVVDDIAPALGEATPLQGISVLRGHIDTLLPQLREPDSSREKVDKDSVAALTFGMGASTLTLPLTRTTFHNNRASTLLSSQYHISQGQPELKERNEKQWQHVHIAFDQPAQSVGGLGLWAPLSPVTRARRITESFGNIVRGIEVNGNSTPASTELEDSVNTMFKHRRATESYQGPMGVWAMVTPETLEADSQLDVQPLDPADILGGGSVQRKDVESAANQLQQMHQRGSRFYQVLSGGGGWGPKKGLLSLDPQQTHFALSEEEEMKRFLETMDNSGFAPPGASIQFFIPAMATPETTACDVTGVVFGVPSSTETSEATKTASNGYLVSNHFGALSSQGIYISGPTDADSPSCHESKLSIPGSRIYVQNSEAKPGKLFKFLGAGGLADAGTIFLA